MKTSRWAALRQHNGLVYLSTQTVSTVGTFMQMFAQAWLVLTITGNRTSLPITIALQTLPLLLFGTRAVTHFSDRYEFGTIRTAPGTDPSSRRSA